MRSFVGRPIIRKVSLIFLSDRTFKKGDCSSSTASACFSASSKTVSPVLLSKSASTTVSFSVSGVAFVVGVAEGERKQNSPAITTATRTKAAGTRIFQSFLPATGASATFPPADEDDVMTAGADPEAGDEATTAGWPISCAS